MAVSFHDGRDKGQFYGLRVYVSLKSSRTPKKCIQEYISFVNTTKTEQKRLWRKAKLREQELVEQYGLYTRDNVKKYPFCGRYRIVAGAEKKSLYSIIGLYDRIQTMASTKGNLPDWGIEDGKHYFNTYPPAFLVQVTEHKNGKRIGAISKNINIRSKQEYYKGYIEAVDFLIEHRPHWAAYRAEMIRNRPTWNIYLDFIAEKFKQNYGKYPWVVKNG